MSTHQNTTLSEAMASLNLTPADPHFLASLPEESGSSPTRFQIDGDKAGTRNGWIYRHQAGGREIVNFGSWKNDDVNTWTSDGKPLTAAEKAAFVAKRKEGEIQQESDRADAVAALPAFLAQLSPETGEHAYLQAKKISRLPENHGLLTTPLKAPRELIMPLQNGAGEIINFVRVYLDREGRWQKWPQKGLQKQGAFHVFEADHPEAEQPEPGAKRKWGILTEGVATALSVHELTQGKMDIVCGLDAGNLPEVVKALHGRYEKLLIAADNDSNGKGFFKAKEAAVIHGNSFIVLAPGGSAGWSDWNDVHAKAGLEVAREAFQTEGKKAVDKGPVKGSAAAKPKTLSLKELLLLPPQQMLIPGFLPHNELSAIFGPFESGKSFIAIDVALHLSLGFTHWHEWPIKKSGGVLYLNGEGYGGFTKRTLAFGAHHGVDVQEAKLRASTIPFPLADEETGSQWAKEEIDKFREEYGEPPVLVVVDTLSRNFGGGDENSTKDMNLFVKTLDEIKAYADGAAVLIVHHTGVSSEAQRRGRGSSVLPGAMEAQWLCKKTGNSISITNAKRKDLKGPDVFTFELTDYDLGYDSDGEPRQSAALRFTGTAEAGKSGGSQKVRLTAVEEKVIRAIKEAAQKGHAVFEDGLFVGVEKNGAAEVFASIHSGCKDDRNRKILFGTTIGTLEEKKGQVIHRDGIITLTSDVEMMLLNKAVQEAKRGENDGDSAIISGQKEGGAIIPDYCKIAAGNEPQKSLFGEGCNNAGTVGNTDAIDCNNFAISPIIADAPLPAITPCNNEITPYEVGVIIAEDYCKGEEGEGEFDVKALEEFEAVFSEHEVGENLEANPEDDPEDDPGQEAPNLLLAKESTPEPEPSPEPDASTTPPPAPSRERPFYPPGIPKEWRPQFFDAKAVYKCDKLSAEEAYDRAEAEILRRIAEAEEQPA